MSGCQDSDSRCRVTGTLPGRAAGGEDHRVRGLRAALPLLLEKDEGRVARILTLWSDPSVAPIEKADTKAASGVWPDLK